MISAYLIEHHDSSNESPLFYTGGLNGIPEWSKDHTQAMKFGQPEDAVSVKQRLETGDGEHRVKCHAWHYVRSTAADNSDAFRK